MDRLWAPWRLGYIKGEADPAAGPPRPLAWLDGADEGCFVCRAVADNSAGPAADRENLVVHRGPHTISILNRYPYNNGHLLVAPRRHQARLDELDAPTQSECVAVLARFAGLIERRMNAQGFNVGLNLGSVAGAGLPGHLHWHLVPRWHGDTNYMPVLAGIKVIPQSLAELWDLLTRDEP